MTENDRKILARACDLNWDIVGCISNLFTTADDWELVRVKVVVLHLDDYAGMSSMSLWSWLLNSPQDCCWDIAQWIKSHPDLFPWVTDFLREKGEKE